MPHVIKPTDREHVGYTSEEMAQARERDIERASLRGEPRRLGKSGRLGMQVDLATVMNAVDGNGTEILLDPEASREFWGDMKRRHPHIDANPDKGSRRMPLGRNRHGRVSSRTCYRPEDYFQ